MNNKKKVFRRFIFLPVLFPVLTAAQNTYPAVEIINTNAKTHIRGLSAVNDNIVWVSGNNGMVGKSNNGGKNWKWITVKGFEKTDFRDIEAFDASTAIIMGIGEPAYLLKTTDGGDTWKVVYENKSKGMFLDAMDFSNPLHGIVIGDPVDGHFFIAQTTDGGDNWVEIAKENRPKADNGEAFFAASGTNVRFLFNQQIIMASGGLRSRLFVGSRSFSLPIIQGKETTGANSVAVFDTYKKGAGNRMIVVGGDFTADSINDKNCFYTTNAGKTWKQPSVPPHGYRSCVEFLSKSNIVSCGPTGVDYSIDGGKTWKLISTEGFHVCRFAKFGSSVFLAGSNGKIGRLVWKK